MKRFEFAIAIFSLVLLGCSSDNSKHDFEKNNAAKDSLELELTMLKNQAFCYCYYKSTEKENVQIIPPDGTTYIELSHLVCKYGYDPNLILIINKWVEKKYLAYSEDDRLYLMRCLDFYNSKELNNYIDSVRKIEINELLIKAK